MLASNRRSALARISHQLKCSAGGCEHYSGPEQENKFLRHGNHAKKMSACGHQPSCSNRLGESSRLAVFLLFYKEKGFYAQGGLKRQSCCPGGARLCARGPPVMRTCLLLCARSPLLCVRTSLLCVLNGLFFGPLFFSEKNGLKFENLAQKNEI